jgi:predicted RNase H-like HicB family nuclease
VQSLSKKRKKQLLSVPGLLGCVATGDTVEETEREIREAIEFHIKGAD